MGRECRRVPKNWVPPRREDDPTRVQPHFDEDFETAMAEWKAGFLAWVPSEHDGMEYHEYNGGPPDREYYRPKWSDEERTHYMMYSTTTEGSPMSPAFETPEKLARWLADTGASAFGYSTATYEQWLSVCRGAYAPSAIYTPATGLISGVEAAGGLSQ